MRTELVGASLERGFARLSSKLAQINIRLDELLTEQQRHANRLLIALISVVAVATAAILGGMAVIF